MPWEGEAHINACQKLQHIVAKKMSRFKLESLYSSVNGCLWTYFCSTEVSTLCKLQLFYAYVQTQELK